MKRRLNSPFTLLAVPPGLRAKPFVWFVPFVVKNSGSLFLLSAGFIRYLVQVSGFAPVLELVVTYV